MKKWLPVFVVGGVFYILFLSWLVLRTPQTVQTPSIAPRISDKNTKVFVFVKQGVLYTRHQDGSDEQKITISGIDIPYTSDDSELGQTPDGRFITFVNTKTNQLTILDLSLEKKNTIASLAIPLYLLLPNKSELFYKKADSLYRYSMVTYQEYVAAKIGDLTLSNISSFGDKIILKHTDAFGSSYFYIRLDENELVALDKGIFSGGVLDFTPFFIQDKNHLVHSKGKSIFLYNLVSGDDSLLYTSSERIRYIFPSFSGTDVYFFIGSEHVFDLFKITVSTKNVEKIDRLEFPSDSTNEMVQTIRYANAKTNTVLYIQLILLPKSLNSLNIKGIDNLSSYINGLKRDGKLKVEMWRYNIVNKQLDRIE